MPLLAVPDLHAPLGTWAQCYGENGYPVFPCRGKTPLTTHGFHDATCDPFQIEIWWRQWPDGNIGTPMGHGRFALDIDPRAGGDDSLFALERQYGPLPHTLMSHTGGGGTHYIYLEPASGILNKASIGQGIDVQGRGSYIIMPPSIHPDTRKAYAWDVVDGPDDIDPQPAPDWLLALLAAGAGMGGQAGKAVAAPGAPIPLGIQENTLTSLAGAMRRAGATADEIRAALDAINGRCTPPVASTDLDRISRSIGRYDPPPQMFIGTAPPVTGNGPTPQPLTTQHWGTPPLILQITDLADMLERHYPLPTWLIKDLIPEGLTFVVGSPKSSKTYLAYSLALSLAYEAQRGGEWLGHYPILNPGPVVYLSLEDDEADSRWRIAELAPALATIPRERFLFIHGMDLPRFDAGLVDILREQILERYHPSLVVLDPISYLYAPLKKGGDQFSEVKDMLLPLRWLGKTYHSTILAVDHRRKKSADDIDIVETTYGSNAKIAVADAILVIVRDDQEVTMHARIRKAGDQTLTLSLTFQDDGTAIWAWKGSTDGILHAGQYGDLRMKVMTALMASPLPMSVEEMLLTLNMPSSQQTKDSLKKIFWRALKANEVEKTSRGRYVWVGGN